MFSPLDADKKGWFLGSGIGGIEALMIKGGGEAEEVRVEGLNGRKDWVEGLGERTGWKEWVKGLDDLPAGDNRSVQKLSI